MSKKKNCRMTPEERSIHDEAVRLRRMSDQQLVAAFHRSGDAENAHTRVESNRADNNASSLETLLQALSEGKCKGIKGATTYKVAQFAAELELV